MESGAVEAFMDQCLRDLGTDISKTKAYRAKRKACENVQGNHKKQYKRIRDYLQTLVDKNPGSTAVVSTINRDALGLCPIFSGLNFHMLQCSKARVPRGLHAFHK